MATNLCDGFIAHRVSLEDVDVIFTHLPEELIREATRIINADPSVRLLGAIPENWWEECLMSWKATCPNPALLCPLLLHHR